MGTYRRLQGVWKSTPETCGKQVENVFCMAHSGGTTYSQVLPKYSAPWIHKACIVNRSQKTCVQAPRKLDCGTNAPPLRGLTTEGESLFAFDFG